MSTLLERPLPTHLNPTRIVRRLATNADFWHQVVEFDADQRWYTRIAREQHWEAWLLSWLPGQGTEWHDHGGSAGAFTVLRGALTERTAGPDLIVERGVRHLVEGDLRAFGSHHLHRVQNHETEPAVSLHVYAPGLDEMNDYAEVGGGLLELIESRRAGVSW